MKILRRKLNVQYHGSNVVETRVSGVNWTRSQVKKYVQARSDAFKKKGVNCSIGTALKAKDGSRRGTKFSKVGEQVRLYTFADSDGHNDPENYKTFSYYVISGFPTYGGKDDKYNNCL